MFDIDERLGSDEVKYPDRVLGRLRVDHGDIAVEGHGGVSVILENVDVVETVRLGKSAFARSVRRTQRERRGVLGETVDVFGAREGDVEGEALGS